MTRLEFGTIMAYLAIGCGKELPAESQRVYFDLLGDLNPDVLQIAAKRVILEHPWATFPSIAELRAAAALTVRGKVQELSPAEAWEKAWTAIKKIDPEQEGSIGRGLEGLPSLVIEAVNAFGITALCFGEEPLGVVRAQFMKIFEQLSAREQAKALLPPSIKNELAGIREYQSLPIRISSAIESIGEMK